MATDLYDTAKRGLNKGRNFRHIMLANPELKKTDKERLHNAYDALHRYAPEFTADPMVGGSLLKSVIDLPGNEHTVIKDLINARKNLLDSKRSQYQPGKTEIELPDKYDIAADAARRAHEYEMETRRQGFTSTQSNVQFDQQRALAEIRHTRQLELEGHKAGLSARALEHEADLKSRERMTDLERREEADRFYGGKKPNKPHGF
jgi:hypothetical protein